MQIKTKFSMCMCFAMQRSHIQLPPFPSRADMFWNSKPQCVYECFFLLLFYSFYVKIAFIEMHSLLTFIRNIKHELKLWFIIFLDCIRRCQRRRIRRLRRLQRWWCWWRFFRMENASILSTLQLIQDIVEWHFWMLPKPLYDSANDCYRWKT